jgi:chemotaxis protein MotB
VRVNAPRTAVLVAALVSVGSTGCLVPKADYDTCVADAAKAKAAAEAKQKDDAATIVHLQQSLAAAEASTQDRDARIEELSTSSHNLQAQLDEATAINQQLRAELERLGKNVDQILAERGTLSRALDDARARLAELRKAQAAAEARTMLFKDFAARFKALIDARQLAIESRRGRLVMEVSGDLLFEPNHAELRSAGKGVLMEIARAIETSSPPSSGRRFLVTAHVDDEPIKSKRYRTSWDLTVARAVSVVAYLVSLGVKPESLTAAGAGSYDPLVANDSKDDRAKNRRVEIALLPSADEAPGGAPAAVQAP